MMQRNVTGVILAAGMGRRLGALGDQTPKTLLPVAGRPLIAYAFEFLKAIGVTSTVVVTGYAAEKISETVRAIAPDARIAHNADFQKGNIYTLFAAFESTPGSVLVMNVDHLYDLDRSSVIPSFLQDQLTVFCDFQKTPSMDERCVRVGSNQTITQIGKGIVNPSAVCVGLTYIPEEQRKEYLNAIPATVERIGEKAGYEDVLQTLAEHSVPMIAADVSGVNPFEIDTPEEYEIAEKGVRANEARFWRGTR